MKLVNHIYWKQKAHFALQSDCYHTWVVFAVEEGVFRYKIGEESGLASFGDVVVCPPGIAFWRQAVTPLSFHFIQFTRSDEVVQDMDSCPSSVKLHFNDTKRLSSNYAYLRQFYEDSSPSVQQWKMHLMNDIWQLHHIESRQELVPERKFTEDALMSDAAGFIEERCGKAVSLQEIARSLALSPVQFTRRFQEAFNETPSQYLKTIRLRRARSLLNDSELNLTQIAERCGYENGFYLSRVFSNAMGMSPSEYRRKHRV
ncbi:helix-turn-helix domain-containing protein [Paenibacillus sp. FA6]|uniref:helix-turn-helix domain-containing protein n=1 Tax=Paenibacillus sp. FA6 TaxID=3413029 RepID=UPI003F65D1E2